LPVETSNAAYGKDEKGIATALRKPKKQYLGKRRRF